MSACILSGFARKKKYVGTIYACDGSDIPSTQDFGTVQFSGPYEAAQTVPATTVTYTIIGKTQCGDDIRRITTKTYSSRAVASQYKHVSASLNEGISGGTRATIIDTVYAASDSIARQALAVANISVVPDPYIFTFDGDNFNLSGKIDGGVGYGIKYTTCLRNGSPIIDTYIIWRTNPVGVTTGPMSIYYLDVHEVWTYDLV